MADYISERTAGRIIGDGFRVYFGNFLTLFLIYVVPVAPFVVLGAIAQSGQDLSLIIIATVIQLLVGLFSVGAMTVAVSDICLGNQPNFARSYAAVFRVLGKYFGTYFLYVVIVIAGYILLVIPGIYLSFALIFTLPVCIIERRSVMESIKRSYRLAKGSWWRIFGIFMLLFLVFLGCTILVQIPAALIFMATGPENIFGALLSGLISIVMFPFMQVAYVLLYYDIRARKEHFDGAALATELMT